MKSKLIPVFLLFSFFWGTKAIAQDLKYVGLELPNFLIMPSRPLSFSFGFNIGNINHHRILDVKLSTGINFPATIHKSHSQYNLSFDGPFYQNIGLELSYNLNYSHRHYWNIIAGYHSNNLNFFRTICNEFIASDQSTLFCNDWEKRTVRRKSHTLLLGLGHTLNFTLGKVKFGLQSNFIASLPIFKKQNIKIEDIEDVSGTKFSEQDIPTVWKHLSYGIYALDQKIRFNFRPLLFVRYEI